MNESRITVRSIVLGILFSAVFAAVSIITTNRQAMWLSACQIPVLPYFLLIVMMLLLNPLCRLARVIRVFSTVEILVIFLMGVVSAGIPNYGLVEQMLPIVGSLFNQEWNNKQSEWNRYVVPFVNSDYFVSEPGLQTAAREYHDALEKSLELKTAHEAACRGQEGQARVAAAEAELKKAQTVASQTAEQRSVGVSRATAILDNARRTGRKAEQEWETLRSRGLPSLEEVCQTYPALIRQSDDRVDQAKRRLAELEVRAFEKVALFRRGLPRGLNAYPGFFPMPDDDWSSYAGRFRRLVKGMAALKTLKQACQDLKSLPADPLLDSVTAPRLNRYLDSVLAELQPMTETGIFEQRREQLQKEDQWVSQHGQELDRQVKQLNEARRNAARQRALELERQIDDVISESKTLDKLQARLKLKREQNERQLTCAGNVRKLYEDIQALKTDAQTGRMTANTLQTRLQAMIPAFLSMDVSLRRYFIGEVPWCHWVKPLVRWLVLIGMTYVILMSLNILIFRQWAHNEKLTYPLAELPKALLGDVRAEGGIPDLFRNGLFWVGVGISGTVMGWNLLCATNLVPGLNPFDLNNVWGAHLYNTPFTALSRTQSHIFFTMIGLSFLIPKNISFSFWFFYILYLVQLQLMVWTGQGQDMRSFPTNWFYLLNFMTAEGQGATMVFSSVVLYKCRKYLFCAFMPSSIAELDQDERKELKLASWAFLGGSIGVIVQLSWGMGANLAHIIFCYGVILLMTIGMVRAVTEGGLLAVKTYISPFHFIRAFFGLNQKWTAVSLFTPLMLYFGVMFMDIKSFIAPAMANALKLRDDFRLRRWLFHGALALAIVTAVLVALITALMMCYARGADTMNIWFYTKLPQGAIFGPIRDMVKDAPAASPSSALWLSVGAVLMAALLYCRQFVFWLPHPLGMVMLVNPIMHLYWFSILLGWLGNVVVTKYGSKEVYHRVCGLFIGLIVGELVIVILAMCISLATGKTIPIDLNRW